MSLIYQPKGRAREYSPLALNIYSGGCDHGCHYCYCQTMPGGWGLVPKPRNLAGLAKEAARAGRQILLSFMGDPYCAAETAQGATRRALGVLAEAGCSVAVLTKGGSRCLADLELFRRWPGGRIKVGASLTFADRARSAYYEPGAASSDDRLFALSELHRAGVKTWASIEPVIDAEESLKIIKASLPWVDAYKVGKLNHQGSTTDWSAFGVREAELIREAGKALYIKDDLAALLPAGFCRPGERDADAFALPDRPAPQALL